MSLSPTVRPAASVVTQSRADIVRLIEHLRTDAATEIDLAFPRQLKHYQVPGVSAFGLSRAKNGDVSNPLYRTACYIVALRMSGAPREKAQRIVDWLQSLVDLLWPPKHDASARSLVRREQEIDGAEDLAECDYLLASPGAAAVWLGCIRERRAHDASLIAALEAEVYGRGAS